MLNSCDVALSCYSYWPATGSETPQVAYRARWSTIESLTIFEIWYDDVPLAGGCLDLKSVNPDLTDSNLDLRTVPNLSHGCCIALRSGLSVAGVTSSVCGLVAGVCWRPAPLSSVTVCV